MLPEKIIFVGVIISLLGIIGVFFYIKNIFYGSIKPNLVSWFFWALAPLLGAFFQIKAGAVLSVLPVFIAGFGPLVVFIFCLFKKERYWKITKFDIFCGIFSFFALIFYIFTKNLGISILFAILSDCLAAIPTIKKSWNFPKTESAFIYMIGITTNIIGLFVIKNWVFSIYSFSIYLIIMNTIITFSIYQKRIFRKI